MACEWAKSTVGEVSQRVTKGTTPTTIGGRFTETGVTFVKVESITEDGRFDRAKFAFVDDETNRLLTRSVLEEDDILFTIAGTIGRVARVAREILPANTNQAVAIIRPNPNVIDPRFLYYVLRDDVRVKHAQTRVVQSVQANFSLAELSAVEVPLPPLREQRAIAYILGTLDDKIELNRRMNETLEQMARALFKAWFVDFEPVCAKMEGRWKKSQSLPGLPAHLWDLFPDRLVDSELGKIPEGWEVGTLRDFAEVTSGKRPRQVFPEAIPEAAIPLWGGNGPMGYVNEQLYSRPILLTGRVGTLGSVFRISTPCWPSDNTLIVLPRTERVFEYLYFCMKSFDFEALNRGSTQPLITQTDLKNQNLLIPPDDVLHEFHRLATACFKKIDRANNESYTLSALRDVLLPKLIRGEIRVKDAERFVQSAL